ncbi:hypothetical protein PLAN_60312 [Planktothrix rubescens CCAP 1459/22]|uniref:Uncharacterized protein n=1 Tax=Planktothrix rubescens CCAP 1459/22 TaxID=329571 RepID=A0A6J7ZNH2_PLARU|nr:hypothetical protein PLAN_60312 [Planktothrix rubescens NIVA-CYA 18]
MQLPPHSNTKPNYEVKDFRPNFSIMVGGFDISLSSCGAGVQNSVCPVA